MGALVRDDLVVEAEAKAYFVEKECGNAFSGDVLLRGTENHPLCKPMVDHDQKGIEAGRRGEVGDKVTRDLLEGAECGGVNRGEQGNSRMSVGFVLLAGCAAFVIFMDVGGKAGPPKFSRNELASFQVAGVASCGVVMAALEDSMVQGVVIGNIDAALIG